MEFNLRIYAEVSPGQTIVIPKHRCAVSFEVKDCTPCTKMEKIKLNSESSPMISSSGSGILLNGPGMITLFAQVITEFFEGAYGRPVHIAAILLISGSDRPIVLTETLYPEPGIITESSRQISNWVSSPPISDDVEYFVV